MQRWNENSDIVKEVQKKDEVKIKKELVKKKWKRGENYGI